jgi:hypothetical protein
VTKIEVSKDAGTTYTTVFTGSQSINIASVTAGAVAAGLVSGAVLDVGTYDTVRVTIGATLQVKGYANDGGNTYYTDGGTDAGAFSINAGVTNTPGADYAVSSYTIPAANRTDVTSGLSMVVTPEGSPRVKVTFDTSGVLSVSGGVLSPGAPSVTVTAN